jgi:hypothetical protein
VLEVERTLATVSRIGCFMTSEAVLEDQAEPIATLKMIIIVEAI